MISEFQSPDFHQPIMLLFGIGLVFMLLVGIRRERANVVEWLLGVVFILQALVSSRQVAPCAMVLAPLAAQVLCERYRWARELAPRRQVRRLLVLNWVLLALAIGGAGLYGRHPSIADRVQVGREPSARNMPVAGAEYIVAHGLPDPVFNFQSWGGYLIYRWFPERRVFIDGRFDMYGYEIATEYMRVAGVKPDWQEILDKYDIRTMLLRKDSALSVVAAISGQWERVFQGEVEDVFVRRVGRSGAPLPRQHSRSTPMAARQMASG